MDGTVFDLINIHLFHDASNFVAMETVMQFPSFKFPFTKDFCLINFIRIILSFQFPSVYSKTRRRALEHTLDRFHNDHYPNVPYFLFGDFNFRTDTAGVIKVRDLMRRCDEISSVKE